MPVSGASIEVMRDQQQNDEDDILTPKQHPKSPQRIILSRQKPQGGKHDETMMRN